MGIPIFADNSDGEYANSKLLTKTLVMQIISQDEKHIKNDLMEITVIRLRISKIREEMQNKKISELRHCMTKDQLKANNISKYERSI